jgi:hypothetical protein
MQQKQFTLSCVGSFVIVLASGSYAAAASTDLAVVTDPGSLYYIQKENHFFGLHIDKAIEHARDAEIAGNMGQAAELQEHAKMSLMRAHEAQRAGNVPGLNEGIANLRKALSLPQGSTQGSAPRSSQGTDSQELTGTPREEAPVRSATDFVREARKSLSQAAGTKYVAIQSEPMAAAVSTER